MLQAADQSRGAGLHLQCLRSPTFFLPLPHPSPRSPPNRVISLDRRGLNRAVPWPGESLCECQSGFKGDQESDGARVGQNALFRCVLREGSFGY